MSTPPPPVIPREGKLVNVVPVSLKEAALDSPSFRATTQHFSEQIDLVERWLDSYLRANARLTSELSSLEAVSNGILGHLAAPINVTEAVVDHDYAFPPMKRYGDSFRDCWIGMIATLKKFDALAMEPVRNFIQVDLRAFKDVRRILDQAQKHYDQLQARYSSQGKSKEPSSIREDAFQLHEARKAYLKASMDFCVQSPQLKLKLEKLLVNTFFDQWREFKSSRENTAPAFIKCTHEMERIKGWTHEMESGEKVARRDIAAARKQIEETVEQAVRPSRELEDYSISTVPYLGSHGPAPVDMGKDSIFKPEKQGWLNLRILTGKPTRTLWARRWAFLKNGIFGCLVYNSRTGGVEESERIGVLLCSIRPAFQEERRFCFEVKTKSSTILLQAETQKELTEWIGSFEAAKRRALESPSSELPPFAKSTTPDPAFAISQPPAPEFTADVSESLTPNATDEQSNVDRSSTALDRDGLAIRSSADFTSSRRSTNPDREEPGRDHASRIIQKLDIHRKSIANSPHLAPPSPATPSGIASLISASHNLLPLGTNSQPNQGDMESGRWKSSHMMPLDAPHCTLAPVTLANPPVPTSMSTAAVIVSNERGIGVGLADSTGAVPTGMMANLWGSSHWGMINNLQRGENDANTAGEKMSDSQAEKSPDGALRAQNRSPVSRHRQTMSLGDTDSFQQETQGQGQAAAAEYPSFYPHILKPHDSQFRLLFPYVPRDETLVLVHRATFSPNDQQDFPGRVFATTRNIYFYSNHFGLVLTTCASLSSITDVTAASGRDCDFLYLHVIPNMGSDIPGRLTVKTFLEPLKLLQKRLNFLIENAKSDRPADLELVFKTLLKLETDGLARSPSMESWEDVTINTPVDSGPQQSSGVPTTKPEHVLKPGIFIDNDLEVGPNKQGNRSEVSRFRLPSQPVVYEPQGSLNLAAESFYNIGTKALFHVLFGDKSPVWQLSQHQRMARNLKQTPWTNKESSHMRRSLAYQVEIHDLFGRSELADLSDYQIVDVFNDHLCYVVTDKRTPWHLPFRRHFRLVSKIVITHVSKSKCKLAIFTKVEWLTQPWLVKAVIDRKAMNDLQQDALDLIDLVSDQVKKMGVPANTKKAVSTFGDVGRQTDASALGGFAELNTELRRPLKQKRLMRLVLESSGSLLESAVSSLLIWFWAVLRWAWKVSSANKAMLLFLIGSLLVNGFHSYHHTVDWWNERTASNFMTRMGVGPNTVLSKAIYLRDMDAAIARPSGIETLNPSRCFSVFSENNAITETPFSMSTIPARDPATRHAAHRLQRTRQRLGSYRHDLLVALRVVNKVEKEVLQAEWETWVERETRRCHMLDDAFNDRDENANDDNDTATDARKRFSGRKEEVDRWYKDYCLSCERVHDEMESMKS